jgi:hypothetical protein
VARLRPALFFRAEGASSTEDPLAASDVVALLALCEVRFGVSGWTSASEVEDLNVLGVNFM